MKAAPPWQTWLFLLATASAILSMGIIQPDLTAQAFILVALVAVFGLPHGALDLPIAQKLWPLEGWRGTLRFSTLYLGIAGLVLIFWIIAPGAALVAFLAYSSVHFSADWDDSPAILRWTGGIATIAAPALFHRHEVMQIFGYLAPPSSAEPVATGLAALGVAALIGLAGALALRSDLRGRAALEQGTLWVAALSLAPILYFVVYFCALHSVRHMTEALDWTKDRRTAAWTAVLLSGLTVVAAGVASMLIRASDPISIEDTISKTVFIGLAALTVPHMLLVDRFQRHARRNPA
ncbi:Brp/Blh family beta-carotene 15,15'-dioxygenase [Maribius pontilimi]|uniref:Probable beta-carotene 15,15'-dioxygenase n=1 Tax=Palleronia pontilimi TaxID=1964209 RepID=A0A934ICD4_9RHOB|nr:Brp/Blh family beta-carotene 15,15'-dioxygenase [Palleronia pontilimi]MBJ3764559.1 Brp/Blh family beta-carotene 15,15'-dioxygenase [Palleronia pontilimi]